MPSEPRLQQVTIYDDGASPALDAAGVSDYLAATMGCLRVAVRASLLAADRGALPDLARRLAKLKVRDPASPPAEAEPAPAEVAFERRRLANEDRGPFGVLYDGFGLQVLLGELLPPDQRRLDHVHIAFTNRTIGTWDHDDLRYHLRTIILGLPALISTTGLVEAPAKPREFYLARQRLSLTTRPELAHVLLKEQFRDQVLDHDDPRLTEIAKGYAMQAIVYQLTGEPFCPDPDCRLHNAHWQRELLRAQLGGPPEYCPRHQAVLEALRGGG